MSLTPSHIIEFLFCPRFTFFQYVLSIPQFEEKLYKVNRGREIHVLMQDRNREYLRKKQGVVKKEINRYLANEYLRGEVDEVLHLNDNTLAPLDYKFAEYKGRVYETYKTQMYCYSWLIEDNYKKSVRKAFLVYTRSANKIVEVPVADDNKVMVKECAQNIYRIIQHNYYPRSTRYKERCKSCTYRNICTK